MMHGCLIATWTEAGGLGTVAVGNQTARAMSERETLSIDAELSPPFAISLPREQTAPFVFCSPHSGRIYPSALLAATRLDPHSLRKSEDCFVDELFADVADLGAPLIAARFARA